MKNLNYILVNKKPVAVDDFMLTAKFLESDDSIVKQEDVGKSRVSTIFLGIDHNWNSGRPILFETMIFGGRHDQYQDRYSTWEEAERGHLRAVRMVKRNPIWDWLEKQLKKLLKWIDQK